MRTAGVADAGAELLEKLDDLDHLVSQEGATGTLLGHSADDGAQCLLDSRS